MRRTWKRRLAVTLWMAKRIYRRSVDIVRYFLGLDGHTFAFVAKVLGLLLYLYWVSVGLIYESTRFNNYGVNLFEFAVLEDIAFVTAKTWFLFFMPFIVPLVVCLVISGLFFAAALILMQLGRALRKREKIELIPWKKYEGIRFPSVPKWKENVQAESSQNGMKFKEDILIAGAAILYILNWAFFTIRCIVIVLFSGIHFLIGSSIIFVVNSMILVLRLLETLKYLFILFVRRIILASARAAAMAAYILVGATLISPQIVAYLIADSDSLPPNVREVARSIISEPMEGRVCRIEPPACIEDVKHIGSTSNYVMFLLKPGDEQGIATKAGEADFSREVVVVPRENLSSIGSLKSCARRRRRKARRKSRRDGNGFQFQSVMVEQKRRG